MLFTVYTRQQLLKCIQTARSSSKKIGFVPTMGALHQGHIALIRQAKASCDIVICSIFVNPTQFNNPTDLEKYPRTVAADRALLYEANCDVLFLPEVSELYPDGLQLMPINLNGLDTVMEGVFRPGHFAGMVTVVNHLFYAVMPDVAFFGEKDFQQLAIIKYMVNELNLPISIVACATIRETDGLAMSSRNIHLTTEERKQASVIFKTMEACSKLKSDKTPGQLKQWVKNEIERSGIFGLEYVSFVDAATLQPLQQWQLAPQRICLAVTTSKTRLIDNMAL